MKRRRVLVTLELDTDAGLVALRSASWWSRALRSDLRAATNVLQAQANVIRRKRRP